MWDVDVVLETYQTDCGDASSAEFTTKRGEKRRGDGYLSVFFFFFLKIIFLLFGLWMMALSDHQFCGDDAHGY